MAKKIVKKKIIIKKGDKPKKKAVAKVVATSKKVAKPTKKAVTKKTPLKPIHSSGGKVSKKIIASIQPKAKKDKPIKNKAIKKDKILKTAIPKKVENIELKTRLTKPVRKSKGGRKPKNKEEEEEPIIENDILVAQLIESTKRLKKPPKAPKQLRTFTNPMASLTVAQVTDKNKKTTTVPKKEPKGKFELEYVIHTSAGILYEFLTSPSGLSEWFADDVNIHDGIFTFFWEGSEQKARLLGFKDEQYVRLQWLDKPEGSYFEFRIQRDDLTGDISLIITDFADEAADLETSKLLWDSQVHQLLNVIGSY